MTQAQHIQQTPQPLRAFNPATGKEVRTRDTDSPALVEAKLTKAQSAFDIWRKTPIAERGDYLRALAKTLREAASKHANLMTEEMGKPEKEAYGELEKAAFCAEHYAENGASYLERDVIPSDATLSYVQHLPLGPILGILPWNAPYWLALRFLAPALMAGNTCVLKHDPNVPGCAQAIEQAFKDAGFPEGVMQVLYLHTPEVEQVIRDPRIQAVSFTGSSKGGAAVASIAASEIKPCVMELGGSDPFIILQDADLEKATDTAALSRIINAGQSCIAAKRIIVEASVYDDVVALLEKKFARLNVGDPTDTSNHIGPIARADLRENLHGQVQKTVQQGGKCLMGGTLPDGAGFFYPMTLLVDVTPDMCAFREETFGPVGVVIKAEDAAHALAMANNTPYGLGSSIWSHDAERAQAMAQDIFAGQVSINGIVKTDPRLPSGGVKNSGYGRELGALGIKEFTNAQQVWIGPAK